MSNFLHGLLHKNKTEWPRHSRFAHSTHAPLTFPPNMSSVDAF